MRSRISSRGWSTYVHDLNGNPPPRPCELRLEDPARPNAGDLLRPGKLIETSYRSGPYLIEAVTPWTYYEGVVAWNVVGLRTDDDNIAKSHDQNRGWINEIVAVWGGDTVRFLKLFRNCPDELFLIGDGYRISRSGQLSFV